MRSIIQCFLSFTALTVSTAWGSVISFSGAFTQDDQVQLFVYTVQNQGQVTVSTTSYATGGFSPILSIFDSTGLLVKFNSGFGSNSDASISWVSDAAAEYTVALTEYDNFPYAAGDNGYLSEGFQEAGYGNFTATPPFNYTNQPGGFYSGTDLSVPLTGDWAVTISAPDAAGTLTASAVPEPASVALTLAGAVLLLVRKRKQHNPRP
jgi:hypothetical protein